MSVSTSAPIGPLSYRYSSAGTLLGLYDAAGNAVTTGSGATGGGGVGLAADRPAASSDNIGYIYYSTDTAIAEISNGVSYVQLAARTTAEDGIEAVTWANRGTATAGLIKRITNLGNNATVLAIGDGTYWQPMGGRQLIYSSQAVVNGTNANPSVITLPTVVIPGGLMGIYGGFEVEIATSITDGAATTANTISYTFDGFELFGTDNTTSRRLWFARRVKNQGDASIQTVMSNASGSGAYIAAANDPKATTKATASDCTLAGTATATCGVAKVNRLDEFKVWWI